MKKYALLFLLPAVFLLAGCGEKTGTKIGGVDYPELYKSENLPQYKDASLAQIINNGPTLKEGVLLRLESAKDVKTIATYYDEQMKALGWTMPAVNTPTETSYATQYNKGDKYVQMTVSNITGKSQTITLSLMQK
ncbi:MAG TPA: hypothetical protein P5232_03260 [Candidatus Moranbacteria bacterium]|nr:hypothetical protein [Candidatus Moranbacteria bacterium]